MARWNSANVLQSTVGGRRLWHLESQGDKFAVDSEMTLIVNEPGPADQVGKDWHTLFRKKLNVAWLPPDKVYFRVVHLPSSDAAEVASMVELQLEKVSPLPSTHTVWTFFLLPKPLDKPESLQPVLVILASRSGVEEFLGQLQTEGFLADRLEAPGLEQLLATPIDQEGVWIFAGEAGEPALVAWHYNGFLQNVTLVQLATTPERGAQLRTQLEQTAWTGELEGWLNGSLKIFLIAQANEVPYWETTFKDWAESFTVIAPPTPRQLAESSAVRCAGEASSTSLLPEEYTKRYHQQFVDRLWIRALMGVGALYLLGVIFYFGVLYIFKVKAAVVKHDLVAMGPAYTNSLHDVEQIRILRRNEALKFAGLDCWKSVAENLPDSMTVDSMYFKLGKLELRGTVIAENQEDVGNFNEALRTATDPNRHQPLFTDVSPPTIRLGTGRGDWSFNCSLADGGQQ